MSNQSAELWLTSYQGALDAEQQGDLSAAIELYAVAAKHRPEHAVTWCSLGCVLLEAGQYLEARGAFEQAVSLDAELPLAHIGLGHAMVGIGDLVSAEDAFRRGVALRRESSSLVCLGAVLREQGKLQESEKVIREAVSFEPSFSEAWFNLALVLKQLSRWQEAREALVRALAIDPHYCVALVQLREVERSLSMMDGDRRRQQPTE